MFSIPLATKDQAYPTLQTWQLEVERETGDRVRMYSVDNGTELKSGQVETWLKETGTQQQFLAPYTSTHIGRVEHMHHTLIGKARAMRLYAKCPENLWDKFYLTATHLHVKVWTCNLDNQTPFELWKGWKPDYSYMHEIRCHAFILIQNQHNPKLFECLIECVLVGYDLQSKTYCCYDCQCKVVYSSYHVRFIESHEAPTTPSPAPAPLPIMPLSSEPVTVDNIAHGANSTPILFDGEEEEFLPPSLQQPIPDNSKNNEDCVDLTPLDDPDTTINHGDLNDPDPPSDHGDLIDHLDQNAPVKPQRSNHQK